MGRRGIPAWRVAAATAIVVPLSAIGLAIVSPETMPDVRVAVAADAPYTFAGKGKGHGRGMGQWGAFAYAKQGWAAERILGHYYSDTILGSVPPGKIAVRLQGRDGKQLDVYSDAGLVVAGRSVPAGEAVHMQPKPDGGASVTVTAGCGGAVLWQGETDNPWIDPVELGVDRPGREHLKLCDGNVGYRGSLGVAREGADARTVNYADLDDYLLGVVPAEMQPNWADKGGAEALRAQAIAARSYAASEHRYPYAQTCDTQSCQVYAGTAKEDPRTTDAVRSTQGKVLLKDGKVVRAEYSASKGAEADTVWTKTVTAGEISDKFGVGELHTIEVVRRSPTGSATLLRIVGAADTVEVTGEEVRAKLGLDSDWFEVAAGTEAKPPNAPAAPPNSPPGSGSAATPPVPAQAAAPTPAAPSPPAVQADPPGQRPAAAGESPIEAKYRELGGLASTLGAPLGPEMQLSGKIGKFRMFANGVIIWTEQLGVQVVDGSSVIAPR